MSGLTLTLFSSPRLARDSIPLHLRSRKCLALLAYLAVTGVSHRRDWLATLFWPESASTRAQNSLRYTLPLLRKALDGAWLVVNRETIGLDASHKTAVDVVRFRDLLAQCRTHGHSVREAPQCLPLLEETVELYQGDFMAGFTLRDSPQFDDWQALESEALQREFAGALEQLAEEYTAQGDVEKAIAHAQRWVALDPLQEGAHRALIRLYAELGRQSEALRQYEACEQVLREELGVSPSAETRDLCQAIREGRVPQLQVGPPAVSAVAAAPRHNLPPHPTPFVGREKELSQIVELLADPVCRLLTVIGPGGMGKSRLAIRAAEEHLHAFTDGVWFVPLAPLNSVDLLASTIVDALHVSRYGSMDPNDQLLHYLREKSLLLVLDNFEHLLEGTTLITEMLGEAPGLKVLVTSRERLNLREEWLLPLEGMEYPEEEEMVRVKEEDYSALQLFVQCARQVRPDFLLATAGVSWVARICQLVEGMPLAIELAAPWVRMVGCEVITHEIEGGLDLLATTLRDMPERHRSMRAVFDHSWGLLPAEERSVLKQLSVFRGGFRMEAAEAVAGASLMVLSGLMDKSWIRRSSSGRYEMHESVRQYCEGRLDSGLSEQATRESERSRDRHSHYYAAFLQEREPHLFGRRQGEAFEEILEDMDNVWAAWNWMLERGDVETLGKYVETLWYAGVVRGWYREVEQALEEAAVKLRRQSDLTASQGECPTREQVAVVLADVLSKRAGMCEGLGLSEQAIKLARRALALLRDVEHAAKRDRVRIRAKVRLGWLLWISGDGGQGKQHLQEALTLADEVGDAWMRELALLYLGTCVRNDGRYSEAEGLLEQALAIANETGEQWMKAASLDSLSWVLWAKGEYRRAKALAEESLQIRQELGDRSRIGISWQRLGEIATALGNYDLARQHFQKGLAVADEISDPAVREECLIGQATLALTLGQHERPNGYLKRAALLPIKWAALCERASASSDWARLPVPWASVSKPGTASARDWPGQCNRGRCIQH